MKNAQVNARSWKVFEMAVEITLYDIVDDT